MSSSATGADAGRIRVCLVTDSLNPSGVGSHMLALAAGLRERYEVVVACPASTGGRRLLESARRIDIRAVEVTAPDGTVPPVELDWLGRFDLVHVHAGVAFEGTHVVSLARRAGVPLVVRTEHQPYWVQAPEQAGSYRRTVEMVDRIICVSRGVADTFLLAGVPAERVVVVPNGVPPIRAVDPGPVRRRLGLSGGAPVVLTPARFTERKGHPDLLAAARLVLHQRPDARFLWAGSGPTHRTMEEAVRVAGLVDQVLFRSGADDVADLLAVADVLALPSWYEGMPLVVLEAMAAGVPVVGTRVCGTDEVVEDRVTGRLVPPQDPKALAEALLDLLDDPAAARRCGRAGRRAYEASHTHLRMAADTAAVYQQLLGSPDSAGHPAEAREDESPEPHAP